jgi:hypothetical protein
MSNDKVDSEGQAPKAADVDAALDYLAQENMATMTEIDEKRLVRKIDWWIVPLMCKCAVHFRGKSLIYLRSR